MLDEIKKLLPNLVVKPLPVECYSSHREFKRTGIYRPQRLTTIQYLIQHHFSAINVRPNDPFNWELCWQLMRDLNFEPDKRIFNIYTDKRVSASAHLMVAQDGLPILTVPLEYIAFHAGASERDGIENLNVCSIGIENIYAEGMEPTEEQYKTNALFCSYFVNERDVDVLDILGHKDVAIPAGRKVDPSNFDYEYLIDLIDEVV